MAKFKSTAFERLMTRVEVQPNGCWYYTGAIRRNGYARIKDGEKEKYAHVIAFTAVKGEIPLGMEIDHKCHNPKECAGGWTCPHRRCVNPDHLGIATKSENHSVERSHTGSVLRALKKAVAICPNNHVYTAENTAIYAGKRRCRTCARQRSRDNRAAKLAQLAAQQPTSV